MKLTSLPSFLLLSLPLPTESSPLLAHRNGDEEEAPQNKSFLAALTDPTREMTAGEKLLGAVALIVRLPSFIFGRSWVLIWQRRGRGSW